MSDLTPERLAELRALAEKATPGPWFVECSMDHPNDPEPDYFLEIARWGGSPMLNTVSFCDDETTARYVAAASPDVMAALLDEIYRLRTDAVRLRAIAYMATGREVTDNDDGLVECWSCTADRYAGAGPCYYCGAAAERPARADDRYRVTVYGSGVEGTAHPSLDRMMGGPRPHPSDVWVEWDDDERGWYDGDTLERIPAHDPEPEEG